jgi:transposase-like protein
MAGPDPRAGLGALPELLTLVINAAMCAERGAYLGADRYERSPERRGHANGFKPKTVQTRLGDLTFAVPQVRDGGFYPQTLEKGLRRERALRAALAEMYVQGGSTRKVTAIVEQLCGSQVSSTQVRRARLNWIRPWPPGVPDRSASAAICSWMPTMRKCG